MELQLDNEVWECDEDKLRYLQGQKRMVTIMQRLPEQLEIDIKEKLEMMEEAHGHSSDTTGAD
jgi:hypothetical protein